MKPGTASNSGLGELNYRANRWARSLVTRESHIIGVVIPEIAHTFFSEITAGLQQTIEPHGYTLILCNSAADLQRERRRRWTCCSAAAPTD
ncbi:MAG: hypothetical protein R2748_32890 [Bryobacterales bacterium]